ncbi:MAG: TetR family transcriptional regulator [Nocardioides sp.]|jgi:AcrR family transcriptional regulator|nr:TetR family transcriptional regulator [Nocardioides sp.]
MGRERQILDAAALAFHEKGFHGVGMDELGQRSGLSGPSLYRHFAGKDAILATLLDEALDELTRAAARREGTPGEDLERALRHHVRYAVDNRARVTLYQREARSLPTPLARSFAARRSHYTRLWEELVRDALPHVGPAHVPAVTQAMLGLVFSVAAWPRRALGVEDLESLVLGLTLRGPTA